MEDNFETIVTKKTHEFIKQQLSTLENNRKGQFLGGFKAVQKDIYDTAVAHGWWEDTRNDGEMLMLMVSELSEALEALRHGNPPDDKIPEFNGVTAELADCVIRIMDYAYQRGFPLADAILAKHEFNKTRPYKHGGKKF